MATADYLMQALAPNGNLVTWTSPSPDWLAVGAPTLHDGVYVADSVAISGGGFDLSTDAAPTNAVVLTDASRVTLSDGSFVTLT